MKTPAAVLFNTKSPLEIVDLEIPKLKQGQVLVEVRYSGACGTQLAEIDGLKGEDKWLPHCLGHEGVGEVKEIGPGVSNVNSGDTVVLTWLKGSGQDAGGCSYKLKNQIVNAGAVTTFQKYSVVSENRLFKLDDKNSLKAAVLLGCAAPTGMGVVQNVLKIKEKQSVIIFGSGGIGLHACLAAKNAGATTITVVDPNPERRNVAELFGATDTIDSQTLQSTDSGAENLHNQFDFAVESSGKREVMENSLSFVKPQGGKVVVVGNAEYGSSINVKTNAFNQGKSLLGTWGGDSIPGRDYAGMHQSLLENSKLIDALISAPYSLNNINKALNDFKYGKIARPLIDMSL